MIHSILQNRLNALLVRDPQYLQHLAPLVGHSIVFKVTDLRLNLAYRFHHSYIEVVHHINDPDLVLEGNSINFGRFLLMNDYRQALLQQRRIEFTGELLLLEKVEAFFKAVGLQFPSVLVKRGNSAVANIVENLQEERHVLLSPTLYQHFVDELLTLGSDVDRLKHRLVCTSGK